MNEMTPKFLPHRPGRNRPFWHFGGRFVAETLMPLILELDAAYGRAKADPSFQAELDDLPNITSAAPARSIMLSG